MFVLFNIFEKYILTIVGDYYIFLTNRIRLVVNILINEI